MSMKFPPAPVPPKPVVPPYVGVPTSLRQGMMLIPPHVRELMWRYEVQTTVHPQEVLPRDDGLSAAGDFSSNSGEEGPPEIRLATPKERKPQFESRDIPGGGRYATFPTKQGSVSSTPPHEAAHFADFFLSLISKDHRTRQSDRTLLKSLYKRFCSIDTFDVRQKHQTKLPYGCTNEAEFFAEMMTAYWSSNPYRKQVLYNESPEVYSYAQQVDNRLRQFYLKGKLKPSVGVPAPIDSAFIPPTSTARFRPIAIGPPSSFAAFRPPKPPDVWSMRQAALAGDIADVLKENGVTGIPQYLIDKWNADPELKERVYEVTGSDLPLDLGPFMPTESKDNDLKPADYYYSGLIVGALRDGRVELAEHLLKQWYEKSGI